LIKPYKILIQIYISLPKIKIFSPKESFVNQNWVANFVNLVHSGPSTFSLVILVLHHQLGQSSKLHVYPFIFFYFYFLDFSWGQRWVTTDAPLHNTYEAKSLQNFA
jgi:hypothetical protein